MEHPWIQQFSAAIAQEMKLSEETNGADFRHGYSNGVETVPEEDEDDYEQQADRQYTEEGEEVEYVQAGESQLGNPEIGVVGNEELIDNPGELSTPAEAGTNGVATS